MVEAMPNYFIYSTYASSVALLDDINAPIIGFINYH